MPGRRELKRVQGSRQDERRKLIKAMLKAKEQGSEAKVVGRYLYIGELKYDVTNVPEDFKLIKERT